MLPSEVKMKSYRGFRYDIFEGWRKMPEVTIDGDGYTIVFSRLSERTIDDFCDALNGYFNIWTKFRIDYTDDKGTLSITFRKPTDADKLYNMLSNIEPITFEHEGTIPAVDIARTKVETLIRSCRLTTCIS